MERKLKKVNDDVYLDRGKVGLIDNREKYNEVMDRLEYVLKYRESKKPEIEKYEIEECEDWGDGIDRFYEQNEKNIIEIKTFLSLIDVEKIVRCIAKFKVKNIYRFNEVLKRIYIR